MKFIDFFAGIGGFRRGLELAGHKCVGFCEWDKFATASYTSMHLITDEQRQYLSSLTLKQKQKEILKDEYRNGEWYANDIRNVDAGSLPEANCWTFGAPCQDFSIAGKRAGLDGDRSSLIREIFRLLEEQEEQDRPEWLIYENVKGMLSSNKGLDYLSILSEMDRLGYDIEWQNINSKWFVPQNRERIYTIGHLRRYGIRKILPIEGTDGENSIQQLGCRIAERKNPNAYRVYSADGLSPCLGTMQGGGREPHVALPCFCDMNYGAGIKLTENARTLQSRYYKGINNHAGETSGVALPINVKCININDKNGKERSQQDRVYAIDGDMTALNSSLGGRHNIAIPVLTPDRTNKRQNGRRFKENGEPMFTLTAQDRHGVGVNISGHNVIGITDTCNCLNANDQRKIFGAKQGRTMAALKIKEATNKGYVEVYEGDSINLSVPSSKTRRGRAGRGVAQTLDTSCNQGTPIILKGDKPDITDKNNGIYVEMPEGFMIYAIWYEKEQCYIAIRRLTPKECFRLQGWSDDYYEKAAFVNSDSRLYMQAGNGVTVDVVYAIGKRISCA